jgi:hypothetical protein
MLRYRQSGILAADVVRHCDCLLNGGCFR